MISHSGRYKKGECFRHAVLLMGMFVFVIGLALCAGLQIGLAAMGGDFTTPQLRVKVTALRHTTLSSQVPGRILLLAVRDGDFFTKGQVLAKLDCSVPAAQLKRAEAAARKQQLVYETTKKLEQLNSRSTLELAVARAEAVQAAAEAEIARNILERCIVTAPFSGRVAERMVQENQFVTEGQPLFEILDPSELELEFIASSSWLPWFKPGYIFNVHIDETQSIYQAELIRLSGKVDAVSCLVPQ